MRLEEDNYSLKDTQIPDGWEEVVIGQKKIKLRGPFDDPSIPPSLELIENYNLASRNCRYERLDLVDLWLWDNRVFKVEGRAALKSALYTRAGKKPPSELPHIPSHILQEANELLDRLVGPTPILITLKQLVENLLENCNSLKIADLKKLCLEHQVGGHVAIVSQPYLDHILSGQKTIESRFSQNKIAPYNKIRSGDVIFLKENGGSVLAIIQTLGTEFFGPMKPGEADNVFEQYSKELCVESKFRRTKKDSRYATLIYIGNIMHVRPFNLKKSDRRSWVILNDGSQPKLF